MSEHKCVLSQCCCGCTLRTGAWITAVVCLIFSIISAASSIYDATSNHNNGSWFNVIVNVVMLIVTILLVHGVRTEQPRFMWIWVYTEIVIIVLLLISIIVATIGTLNLFVLIFGLLVICFYVYFVLVVRSYAIELGGGGAGNTV